MKPVFPHIRDMDEPIFALHMQQWHPALAGRSGSSHAAQHGSPYGHYPAHTHRAPEIAEVVAVPAARDMAQWVLLKHIRVRHTYIRVVLYEAGVPTVLYEEGMRDATFEAHKFAHSDIGKSFDHKHNPPKLWATVPRHEALQEASSFPVPVLPAIPDMEPGDYIAHERDRHGTEFRPYAEHDAEHEDWPDMQDHRHKDGS
jgi:hypothetical protein